MSDEEKPRGKQAAVPLDLPALPPGEKCPVCGSRELEAVIDQRYADMLGSTQVSAGEMTKLLEGATKWVAVKRKVTDGDGWGSGLPGGGNG